MYRCAGGSYFSVFSQRRGCRIPFTWHMSLLANVSCAKMSCVSSCTNVNFSSRALSGKEPPSSTLWWRRRQQQQQPFRHQRRHQSGRRNGFRQRWSLQSHASIIQDPSAKIFQTVDAGYRIPSGNITQIQDISAAFAIHRRGARKVRFYHNDLIPCHHPRPPAAVHNAEFWDDPFPNKECQSC